MKLKSIGVLSFALFQAIFMAIMGLIIGLFTVTMFGIAGSMIPVNTEMMAGSFGIGGVIYLIITWAIMGFIFGAIFAFMYNLIAKWTGGVDIELHK